MSDKKEASTGAEMKKAIEQGETTLNQARIQAGLEPIDDPRADERLYSYRLTNPKTGRLAYHKS